MLKILNQKINENNLEKIKSEVKDQTIITDLQHLDFFLKHFKGQQIYVVAKSVIYKNHVTTIIDIASFVNRYDSSYKKFIICANGNLCQIFKNLSTRMK